jgi:hypothetical protein
MNSKTFEGGFDLCHNAYIQEYVISGEDQNGHTRKFSSKRIKNIKRVKIPNMDDFNVLVNKIIDLWRKP